MSDARLRGLERRWKETSDLDDFRRWVEERARTGEYQATVVGGSHYQAEIRIAPVGVSVLGRGWQKKTTEVRSRSGDMAGMGRRARLRQSLEALALEGVVCPFLDAYLEWRADNPDAKRPEWRTYFRTPEGKAHVARHDTTRGTKQ